MTRGKKFNVFMEHVTIDYPTLMKYRKILDCYRSIRMLESHWGFDSDNDDIDFYIIRHMRELQKKIIEEEKEKAQTEAE